MLLELISHYVSETYPESSQKSMMKFLAKIKERSILDVWTGSEYVSAYNEFPITSISQSRAHVIAKYLNTIKYNNALNRLSRSSRREVFSMKGVLRNFAKFTGKHLCQSLQLY